TDSLYLHGLNLLPQLGPVRLSLLSRYFKNFKDAYNASFNELVEAGLTEDLAQEFINKRSQINLEQELEILEKEKIQLLTFKDPVYPKLLLEIPKFPPLLYYKGSLESAEELCVAIVGTRKITNYGRTVVPLLAEPLIDAGVTVVSGMA